MDYIEYEKQEKKNRVRNDKLLDGFKGWLLLSGISNKRVDKHVENVDFYINEYLTYYEVETAESGYSKVNMFFGDWFIRKATWSSEYTIKENITSVKKFYSYLKEIGKIKESEYNILLQIIGEEKGKWLSAVKAYYNEDWLAFYEDEDDEESYDYFEGIDEYQEDLEKLFTLIKNFSEVKPWEWLEDTDVFAIKFKYEDDTYFCCILGNVGEIFGISLYKGLNGLESYLKALNNEYDSEEEAIHIMDATSIYFKDRNDITKEDYEIIQLSGVTFRGKKKWPSTRVFEPGFVPRTIEPWDLDNVTNVMEVVTEYVLYLQENIDKASLMKEGKYLIREYDKTGAYEEYIAKYDDFFLENDNEMEIPILYSEIDIKRVLKNCKKTSDIWELDSFYLTTPVEEDIGEPFYPAVLLIADLGKGIILGHHITHPYDTEEFQLCFLDSIVNSDGIPSKVIIRYNPNIMFLYDIFEQLNIEVEVVDYLKLVPQIKKDMLNDM